MKGQRTVDPLNPSEWYFRDCPKRQLAACCYYEYARFSPEIIAAVERLNGSWREFMHQYPAANYAAVLAHGFPETPWLEHPAAERKRVIGLVHARAAELDLVFKRRVINPRILSHAPTFPEEGESVKTHGQRISVIFDFSWNYSNPELKRAFHRFLEKYRPKETRGKPGRKESHVDYLNALGAKRLIDHCTVPGQGSAVEAAMEIIRKHAMGLKAPPLYGKSSALSGAACKADTILRTLYHFPKEATLDPHGHTAAIYWLPEMFPEPEEPLDYDWVPPDESRGH